MAARDRASCRRASRWPSRRSSWRPPPCGILLPNPPSKRSALRRLRPSLRRAAGCGTEPRLAKGPKPTRSCTLPARCAVQASTGLRRRARCQCGRAGRRGDRGGRFRRGQSRRPRADGDEIYVPAEVNRERGYRAAVGAPAAGGARAGRVRGAPRPPMRLRPRASTSTLPTTNVGTGSRDRSHDRRAYRRNARTRRPFASHRRTARRCRHDANATGAALDRFCGRIPGVPEGCPPVGELDTAWRRNFRRRKRFRS